MTIEERMQEIWGERESAPPFCAFAKPFDVWAHVLCAVVEADARKPAPAGLIAVHQSKIVLLDKYFEYRNFVPKAHRYRVTELGHRCIWHVFAEAYRRLRMVELSLTPPLFLPTPLSSSPQPQQVGGIFILEEDQSE